MNKAITTIAVIVFAVIFVATLWKFADPKYADSIHFSPDGEAIYTVEIDGHQYLKSGETLTHSASCGHKSHDQ
jgi:peroxiredoxin